jgi:hypothetical protein
MSKFKGDREWANGARSQKLDRFLLRCPARSPRLGAQDDEGYKVFGRQTASEAGLTPWIERAGAPKPDPIGNSIYLQRSD